MIDFLKEAKKIADDLLMQAKVSGDKITWFIPKNDTQGNRLRNFDFSLGTGMCGVILSYIELFRATGDEKYLSIIHHSLNGIAEILANEPSGDYGFYTGKSGLIYLYIQAYSITEEERYLENALKLVKGSRPFINSDITTNSLYDGRAGLAMMLLSLYSITNKTEVLALLSYSLRVLLWKADSGSEGLSWYYNFAQSGDVTGWAYGSAGITYFLHLLNEKLDRKVFNSIVNSAYGKILNAWDTEMGNWPNHKNIIESGEQDLMILEKLRSKESLKELLAGQDSLGFSEGALGVVYSLHISDLKLQGNVHQRIMEVTNRIINQDRNPLSIEERSARHFCLQKIRSAFDTLDNPLQEEFTDDKAQVSNLSLSNGLAGKVYHYLTLAGKISNPYFILSTPMSSNLNIRVADLGLNEFDKYFVLHKTLPRTIAILGTDRVENLKSRLTAGGSFGVLDINIILNTVELYIEELEGRLKEIVVESFNLEKSMLRMKDKEHASIFHFASKYYFFQENIDLQKLSEQELLKVELVLNPDIDVVSTSFDASLKNIEKMTARSLSEVQDNYFLLVHSETQDIVRDIRLPELDELIINFDEPLCGEVLFESICEELEMPKKKRRALKERIIDLILSYVQEGVLVRAGSKPWASDSNL